MTQLIEATRNNDAEEVKRLIAEGVDVNVKDEWNDTALIWAVYRGYTEMVKLLLEVPDIDVNTKNKHSYTALMKGVSSGHFEIIKLLLAHPKIDVNVKDGYGWTALMWAVKKGYTEIVRLLLEPGIDVNLQDENGDTALMSAVYGGYIETIKLLLEVPGIDVNVKDGNGDTALAWAVKNGHTEIVELINNFKNKQIMKELIEATRNNDIEEVKRLIGKGFSINEFFGYSHSILMLACYHNHIELVKFLLGCPKIDINIKNLHGWSALEIANFYNYPDIVKLLLDRPEIDINSINKALNLASKHNFIENVKMFLKIEGINIDIKDNLSPTLMDIPSLSKKRSYQGETALIWAVKNGNTEIVELLNNFKNK